jgi:LacI family gluconate utilization system Gnt-I transcriptional repressor
MQDHTIPVEALDTVDRIPTAETAEMAPAKVRIEEVARRAGVSMITVSRALRKPGMVSEKTRARVDEAVRATGFTLNPHASALRSGKSNIVTIFVSSTQSPQYLQAADAFSAIIEKAGYEVVLARTSYSFTREIRLMRTLQQMRPAAAFITGVLEQELNRAMFRRLDIPVVESWAYAVQPIDMLVGVSNTDGARAVARLLAERGYKAPAIITRVSGRGRIRREAFEAECRALGLPPVESVELAAVESMEDGRAALSELLSRGRKIDAVFCANDLLACGALLEARALGLQVPGDLALVGFGDNDLMRELAPGLTTVAPDPVSIGRRAGEMLAARLAGDVLSEPSVCLPLQLKLRGSC